MKAGVESIDPLVRPRGTTEQVTERIREAIVSGRVAPGTWLRESNLANQLHVSRIPVREALARLEAEHLVKRVPFRGTRVEHLSLDQVKESYMLRSLLEGFAAKLATPHLTVAEIARLEDLVVQLKRCGQTGSHEEADRLHREFHTIINNRCGSERLLHWIQELYNQFPKSLHRVIRFEEPPEEYRRIVEAIAARDAELAGKLMSEHLENAAPAALKHYTERLEHEQKDKSILTTRTMSLSSAERSAD
jgi:DNA-binding GntR family transcriptional regulator